MYIKYVTIVVVCRRSIKIYSTFVTEYYETDAI